MPNSEHTAPTLSLPLFIVLKEMNDALRHIILLGETFGETGQRGGGGDPTLFLRVDNLTKQCKELHSLIERSSPLNCTALVRSIEEFEEADGLRLTVEQQEQTKSQLTICKEEGAITNEQYDSLVEAISPKNEGTLPR